jgi:hypothetical protein
MLLKADDAFKALIGTIAQLGGGEGEYRAVSTATPGSLWVSGRLTLKLSHLPLVGRVSNRVVECESERLADLSIVKYQF